MLRTHVYIDGFNLYYGAIRGTTFHWLDLMKMSQLLLPQHQIAALKYYTSIVSARPGDPDKPNRQLTYVRALKSLPNVSVTFGQFMTQRKTYPVDRPLPGQPSFVGVVCTEEKGTDVNNATHLLDDAHADRYDVAVLVSNDSDLAEPLRIVQEVHAKRIGLINPRRTHPSRQLMPYAHFVKTIRPGLLAKCLLPPILQDQQGQIHKPPRW